MKTNPNIETKVELKNKFENGYSKLTLGESRIIGQHFNTSSREDPSTQDFSQRHKKLNLKKKRKQNNWSVCKQSYVNKHLLLKHANLSWRSSLTVQGRLNICQQTVNDTKQWKRPRCLLGDGTKKCVGFFKKATREWGYDRVEAPLKLSWASSEARWYFFLVCEQGRSTHRSSQVGQIWR